MSELERWRQNVVTLEHQRQHEADTERMQQELKEIERFRQGRLILREVTSVGTQFATAVMKNANAVLAEIKNQ